MKKVMFAAAAVAALGTSALAGGLAEAIMEPEVVAEAASTSNAGILVPVLALIMMAAVLADSGSGGILD
jgi:hypothetical protein